MGRESSPSRTLETTFLAFRPASGRMAYRYSVPSFVPASSPFCDIPAVSSSLDALATAPAALAEPSPAAPIASSATAEPAAALPYPETIGPQILWSYAAAFVILHLLACLAFVPWLF